MNNTTKKVTFERFNRIDCHSDLMRIMRGAELVGEIVKSHDQPAHRLSLVDSRGPVAYYELTAYAAEDDVCEMFDVRNYPSARAALTAAKARARQIVGEN